MFKRPTLNLFLVEYYERWIPLAEVVPQAIPHVEVESTL